MPNHHHAVTSTGKYGLPLNVQFCRKCTISNQRPSSTVEFKSRPDAKKSTIAFDEDGVCDACRYFEEKSVIDWSARAAELAEVCNKYRRTDGRFDVIVPGSGGKDSVMAAHILKYKYNMHPLLVTWPPHSYTDPGWRNFQNWLEGGFTNITYWPNPRIHRKLAQIAFRKLVHPFQPFIVGQKNIAPRFSALFDVPFIMYGENQAEYGNSKGDNTSPTMSWEFFAGERDLEKIYLSGVKATQLMAEHQFTRADLEPYLPTSNEALERTQSEVHYMGYYVNWHPQEVYYYCVENTGFKPNDFRTEGSYSKYSSFDDKIDWLHYYTTYAKFGIGRATYDTSQEIRNGDITREDGVALVRRFDGEFPQLYLESNLKYLDLTLEEFNQTIDDARPDHLWEKTADGWKLKHMVS